MFKKNMQDSNFVKIYEDNLFVVQQIVQELKKLNIAPVIKDKTESARLAGFAANNNGHQEVFVKKNELEKAIDVVNKIKAELKL